MFSQLHPAVQKAIRRYGYVRPTPIQEKAIPLVLRGYNVLMVAPTGSGKTEAALLPLASLILSKWGTGGLRVVYVTPLRSLNRDIFERMRRILGEAGVRLQVRHGDTSSVEKKRFLQEPPEIMVTTPETFYFLLSVKKFQEALKGLRAIVVDEVHELLDDKRGAELALAIERAEDYAGYRLQRIGLSATISRPEEAARFLAHNRMVLIVEAGGDRGLEVVVESPEPTADDKVYSKLLRVDEELTARVRRIAELALEASGGVLVFTNTRDTAEVLGALLRRVLGEDKVLVHHGSLSKAERLKAEKMFREGKVKVIVATSSLELGIDIGHVDLVIQYMSPRQALKLVQRAGRSRHRLGETARAVIIASRNLYDILESAVLAARASRGDLEELKPPMKPLDALAHQVAGIIAEKGFTTTEDILWLSRRTVHYSDLGYEDVEQLLKLLHDAKIVRLEDSRVKPGRRLLSYYYSVTMIPDVKQYQVYDIVTGERIGVLDEDFVATLEPGSVFILAGRPWEVVGVEDDRVVVRQAKPGTLLPPAWEGELIPVDWKAARELGSILRRFRDEGERVLDQYPLARSARSYVTSVLREHLSRGLPLPSDRDVVVEVVKDVVFYHAILGSKPSKAFELALAMAFKQVYGYTPLTASTPYAVVVKAARPLRLQEALRPLRLLVEAEWSTVEWLVLEATRRTRLFEWKLYHVAQRMGLIEKGAKPDRRLLQPLRDSLAGVEAVRELMETKIELEPLRMLLEGIRTGRIRVHGVELSEPSPLAREVLAEARIPERVKVETIPSTLIASIVKKRIESKRVRLVCLMCGYTWEATIGDLPEKPRCERCGAGFIAPTRLDESSARRLVEKMRRREKLRGEEAKMARELKEAGSLVLDYGRKAIEALAAHGVGPTTAKRVLRSLVLGGEEAFYKALLEAEQNYVRTRRYWRS